jgi:hypothetical protein
VSQSVSYKWLKAPVGNHTIYAKAIDSYGDTATSDTVHVTISLTVIENVSQNQLSIYPNPANNNVYVQTVEINPEPVSLSISDLNGRLLKLEKQSNAEGTYEIDLAGIPAGVYILKVTNSLQTLNHKLIINK